MSSQSTPLTSLIKADVSESIHLTIGFVVNPFAGIGGPAGLKGSDGADIVAEATARGSEPKAPQRALQALQWLPQLCTQITWVTAPGTMGADVLSHLDQEYRIPESLLSIDPKHSSAQDTQRAVKHFIDESVDLILFAGGDGTARDVVSAADEKTVALGIPAGVKMHSGVYAISPQAAGEILQQWLAGELVTIDPQEVRDIDEKKFREGRVTTQYFGELLVPDSEARVQAVKNAGRELEVLAVEDIAAEMSELWEDDVLYIMGPGSTTKGCLDFIGLDGTLLGVDLLCHGELIAKDVNALSLFEQVSEWVNSGKSARLVLTAIGGQGHILGRGNQQISATLIRLLWQKYGKASVILVATPTKIRELQKRPLLVDTGDSQLDGLLSGHMEVICGYQQRIYYPVGWGQVVLENKPFDLSVHLRGFFDSLTSEQQQESRRTFHGRGRTVAGWEGVTADWFAPCLVVTVFREDQATQTEQALDAFKQVVPSHIEAIVLQRRYLPSAPSDIIWGEIPANPVARRGNLQFGLQLAQQQNLGFFLDMEPGRQWMEEHAKEKTVLNLFSYTCAFSVVAIAAGAQKVVNVDMSRAALNRGRENHRMNHHDMSRVQFLGENILKSWGRIKRSGPFDVVVLDPPSFQKGSFQAERDYVKLFKRLPQLCGQKADVLACLNAPELTSEHLQQWASDAEAFWQAEGVNGVLTFKSRLSSHGDFPDISSASSLKILHFEYIQSI